MKQLYSALILVLITGYSALGQSSVGINTSTPNTKAVLELVSLTNNQGFLVPRLSTAQRQSMLLTGTDRGMMVYDVTLQQFWYWNGTAWKAGLGVLDETTASGDLNGTFPEVYINDGAVGTDELTDVAGNVGTFGSSNDSTILVVTVDVDGRVTSVTEKSVRVGSGNIYDASILNQDIANTTITIAKLNAEGETDKVLATDDTGAIYWEDISAFTSSALPTSYLYIGDAAGVAQGLPASGDVTVTNAGTAVDFQLGIGVVTTVEIDNETIQSEDIMDLSVAEADIAAGAVTEQKIGDDAVTAIKINPDVAGEALIPNPTTGALDVNAGNGLKIAADSVEVDLEDIDGDGIVADLTNRELDVNVDNSTLEVAGDIVQVKDLGITNQKIANQTIYAEAKISPLNPITGSNYVNRILTINVGEEVEWTTLGNSRVLATNAAGEIIGKPLSDFATNNLPEGAIFVGDDAGNAQPLYAGNFNRLLFGNGTDVTSLSLSGDINMSSVTVGLSEIQDNAVQGNDIDATNNPLAIAGTELISITTSNASAQAIRLNASGGGIDIGGNQGVLIDADNNDVDLNAIAGSVNIDANQNTNITTTSGDIILTSGDGISMTGATGSSLTTSSGDLDINAAGQLDLDGGTTVAIDGATGVAITSAANDVDITADDNVNIAGTNAAVGITAGTTVDINADGGNVTIDAAGGGSDVLVTAPDQIEFDATNTQVVSGTFELANGGIQVDEIVDDITVDLASPSDNKLITETALATAIGNQAGSGLTYDALNQEIDLGGALDQTADLVTAAGVNLQVSGLGILDVDTDVDILGDVTLSGAAQSLTHTGATSLDIVSNTAPVTIDAQGNILTLDGDQGVSVDAANNNIDVTAATGLVNVTGNQGVNVNATNNNLTLGAIAGTLVLDGSSGVDIDASTSGDVTINSAAGSVSIDGAEAAGDAVAITASDVSGGIDLTAGTGGIAAVTTDGDVSLTTSSTGNVILDGADDVTITGGTNVTTTATAGTVSLNGDQGVSIAATNNNVSLDAQSGSVGLDGDQGVTIDASTAGDVTINSAAGSVSIDGAEAASDAVSITASDAAGGIELAAGTGDIDLTTTGEVTLNGTNTQVETGSFELNSGTTVTNIQASTGGGGTGVRADGVADDNTLVTESAVREALINSVSADNGLTEGPTQGNIQLGGDLIQNTTITQDNAEELNIVNAGTANTTVQLTSTGDFVVDGQTGDVTIDQDGAITAGNGVAVTGGNVDVTNDLDVDGATTLDQTTISTDDGAFAVSGTNGASINTTSNTAGAITLGTNGGASETIAITNTQGTAANAIDIDATSGGVDIDGGTTVTIDGATGLSIGTAANDIDINAAGQLDLDGGTTVAIDGATGVTINSTANDVDITGAANTNIRATTGDINLNSTAGSVSIDGAEAVSDAVSITASDAAGGIELAAGTGDIDLTTTGEVTLNGTNTQVETGSFELNNGTTVTNIQASTGGGGTGVRADGVADDNTLVTESAVREALINSVSADNGLTEGPTQGNIQLGGDLIQNTTITQDNAEELNIVNAGTANTTVQLTSTGDFVVDGQTGDVTIDQDGAVTAGNGVAVTGGNVDVTNDLDVDGATTLDQTTISTDDGAFAVSGTNGASINTTSNTAGAITLGTNGGASETIAITNTQGTAANAIDIYATAGGVDIDGGTTVAIDGATGLSIGTAANDIDINAAGQLDLDGGTTVAIDGATGVTINSTANDVDITGAANTNIGATTGDITLNSTAGSVSIDGAEAASDAVSITASDAAGGIELAAGTGDIDLTTTGEVTLNGTNTQVETGSFELNSGTTVTNIQASTGGGGTGVRADGVADDNTLVTESAVREALINSVSADNGLTEGPTQGNIQLGGDLIQNTTITQDNAEELNIVNAGTANTTVQLTSTGDFVVDGQTGDVTIDQDGAVTAGNGVAVTGGNVDVTNDLDVDGATTLDQTTVSTDDGAFAVSGTNGASINTTSNTAGAITLGTNGGASETIAITNTQGTAANAIDIDATAGGVDIDGGTTVAIDGATGLSIGTAANDIDINAAGQLDLDGGTTVAIDGATGVTINSTANDVDITGAANTNIGATTGDITLNSTAGSVSIDGAEAASDAVSITASDAAGGIELAAGTGDIDLTTTGEVTLNGTNTQVETGSFELNNGTTVTNIQASTGGGGTGVRADGVAETIPW